MGSFWAVDPVLKGRIPTYSTECIIQPSTRINQENHLHRIKCHAVVWEQETQGFVKQRTPKQSTAVGCGHFWQAERILCIWWWAQVLWNEKAHCLKNLPAFQRVTSCTEMTPGTREGPIDTQVPPPTGHGTVCGHWAPTFQKDDILFCLIRTCHAFSAFGQGSTSIATSGTFWNVQFAWFTVSQ